MALTRSNKINLSIMVVTLVAAVAAWIPTARDRLTDDDRPTAGFAEPRNNDELRGSTHPVRGVSQHIPAGEDVWLIVRTASGLWFPVERCDLGPDGSWAFLPEDVHLGADEAGADLGVYTLSLYLAGPAEDGPLHAYVEGRNNGRDNGLTGLPGGVQHLRSISVTRIQ